ncbi:uncharacterized protein G2W53_043266 [Senna tora]|uniref:Uncharacterized protein n=1 Tax=Senna tora TaxID=362788 RepID=A0A834W0G8_9FABA|nr:uncharacterized protein G2W53_043266 [Senna tora]
MRVGPRDRDVVQRLKETIYAAAIICTSDLQYIYGDIYI